MRIAQRIKNLPPYLFADIDNMLAQAKAQGVDVISFGIGDPDQPTPDFIVRKMQQETENPENHSYPSYQGSLEYRKAVAQWYKKSYGVELNPEAELLALIGSKEGIAHLPFCFIDPGEEGLYPDPSYPVYHSGILLSGGHPLSFPLKKENNFQPDPKDLQKLISPRSKIMFLNYPHNPTGAVADPEILKEIIEIARENNILLAYDGAYNDLVFDDHKPFSILQLDGAREVAVEFGSFSKTFNMTGWRIAWIAGSEKAVEALGRFKTNLDSGAFNAIQNAGIEALENGEGFARKNRESYQKRRDLLVEGLRELGWKVNKNPATFFLWIEVPTEESSSAFCQKLFQDTGVFMTPGSSYGEQGEGFLRLSLTVREERIKEALQRLKKEGYSYS